MAELEMRGVLSRAFTLELVRVTEQAAIAAAQVPWPRQRKGRRPGRRRRDAARTQPAADQGPYRHRRGRARRGADAVHRRDGRLRQRPEVDIAVDPLKATTVCAKDGAGSLAALAMAEGGSLLHAPDIYMNKIAIGPGYPDGTVDLDASPADNINESRQGQGRRAGRRSPPASSTGRATPS